MDEETEAEFRKAVSEWGIETPPLCFQVDGELILVDGKHRLDEAIARGDPQIDVVVREGDMVQVLTRNIYLDHLRGKHKVSDMIRVLKSLYEDYHLDTDQIAAQTYKNRDYVEKLLKIGQADPAVLAGADHPNIGLEKAFQVSRYPRAAQQQEAIAQLEKFKMTAAEVKSAVDDALEYMKQAGEQPVDVPAPQPMAPPVYHCEGCKREVDKRFLALVMLCPDCFGQVWRLGQKSGEPAAGPGEET